MSSALATVLDKASKILNKLSIPTPNLTSTGTLSWRLHIKFCWNQQSDFWDVIEKLISDDDERWWSLRTDGRQTYVVSAQYYHWALSLCLIYITRTLIFHLLRVCFSFQISAKTMLVMNSFGKNKQTNDNNNRKKNTRSCCSTLIPHCFGALLFLGNRAATCEN